MTDLLHSRHERALAAPPPLTYWPLRGGTAALDFANTLAWRPTGRPVDALHSYADLVAWCVYADLLSPDEADRLLRRANSKPQDAAASLTHARSLREAIYQVALAIAHGQQAAGEDLAMINAYRAAGLLHVDLVQAADGFALQTPAQDDGLARPLWLLAEAMTLLLLSADWRRVRECPGDGCGWFFLDQTKNGNRRWCDSADCGNRARVRAYAQRRRATAAALESPL